MLFLESLFPKTVLTTGDMYDLVLILFMVVSGLPGASTEFRAI